MSDQPENKSEKTSEKSDTKIGCTGWIILAIIASIVAFFTYDPDDRTLSYDDALKCMLLSKEKVYYYLNREGAVITEFPNDWDSWNFDHRHINTREQQGNTIVEYVLEYNVPFILAGTKLETNVILNVIHNETADTWSIRKVSVPEFNKYIGQLLQRGR